MENYTTNQDHIHKLKLKERSLLLREMTVQIYELREQIKKDKKLLDEIENSASNNVTNNVLPIMRKSYSAVSRMKNIQSVYYCCFCCIVVYCVDLLLIFICMYMGAIVGNSTLQT
jgi:hypothetical protein